MSLQEEHRSWQEEKIKQSLDRSYAILQERNKSYPVKETIETAVWCSTRGSDVSRVLGNVPKNLQHLVKDLRNRIQETSQQTSDELMENAKERVSLPAETIEVIINICQGQSEIILPIKEIDKGIEKRVYIGCEEVVEQQKIIRYSNSYNSYLVIRLDAITDHQDLGKKIKDELDKRLKSYNLTTDIANNFSFEHSYDKEAKSVLRDRVEAVVKHDPNNRVITIQPPANKNKVKFLPLDLRIKKDIVQMIKDGESYQTIRDKYRLLADQGQIPQSIDDYLRARTFKWLERYNQGAAATGTITLLRRG